jgi:endonuclease/exonuclease/phosphatase family metal-dependent hydrolase/nicotinic acid mononucleotide adenylyltransferase
MSIVFSDNTRKTKDEEYYAWTDTNCVTIDGTLATNDQLQLIHKAATNLKKTVQTKTDGQKFQWKATVTMESTTKGFYISMSSTNARNIVVRRRDVENARFLLTGSFNPVHNGHLEMLEKIRKKISKLGYKKIEGIIITLPDDKIFSPLTLEHNKASKAQRDEMALLAVTDIEKTGVDTFAYSSLSTLLQHHLEDSPNDTTVYHVQEDEQGDIHPDTPEDIHIIRAPLHNQMESEKKVRRSKSRGELEKLVPKSVAEFILRKGLYQLNDSSLPVDRTSRLRDVLQIYTSPEIMKDPLRKLLQNQLNKGGHPETTIVVPRRAQSDKDILDSIKRRYPVFFGKPLVHLYNKKQVEEVLGYSVDKIDQTNAAARYAIVGPVSFEKEKKSQGWAVHVYGVNFEKKTTPDYLKFLNERGEFQSDAAKTSYKNRLEEVFDLAVRGAHHASQITGLPVQLRMPKVGMGAFLTEASEQTKERCREMFEDSLNNIILPSTVKFVFCQTKSEMQLIQKDGFSEEKDLFSMVSVPDNTVVCFVNAWDDRSFIGNGLEFDESIDGMFVAGWKFGEPTKNTSYLHNAFFHNWFENTDRWLRKPPKQEFTVTTYNVLSEYLEGEVNEPFSNYALWANRKGLIVKALQGSDVVLLNEVTKAQKAFISQETKLTVASFILKTGNLDGSAVLYDSNKFEFVDRFQAPINKNETQVVAAARLRTRATGQEVIFVSLHLISSNEVRDNMRAKQLQTAMTKISNKWVDICDTPVVAAGDLNSDYLKGYSTLVSQFVPSLVTPQLRNAAISCSGNMTEKTPTYYFWHKSVFDYVLVSPQVEVVSMNTEMVQNSIAPNATQGSDHFPVTAVLRA